MRQKVPEIENDYDLGQEPEKYYEDVPMVLQWIWGPIELIEIPLLEKSPAFNQIKCKLCQDCFLYLSKFKFSESLEEKFDRINRIRICKGMQESQKLKLRKVRSDKIP